LTVIAFYVINIALILILWYSNLYVNKFAFTLLSAVEILCSGACYLPHIFNIRRRIRKRNRSIVMSIMMDENGKFLNFPPPTRPILSEHRSQSLYNMFCFWKALEDQIERDNERRKQIESAFETSQQSQSQNPQVPGGLLRKQTLEMKNEEPYIREQKKKEAEKFLNEFSRVAGISLQPCSVNTRVENGCSIMSPPPSSPAVSSASASISKLASLPSKQETETNSFLLKINELNIDELELYEQWSLGTLGWALFFKLWMTLCFYFLQGFTYLSETVNESANSVFPDISWALATIILFQIARTICIDIGFLINSKFPRKLENRYFAQFGIQMLFYFFYRNLFIGIGSWAGTIVLTVIVLLTRILGYPLYMIESVYRFRFETMKAYVAQRNWLRVLLPLFDESTNSYDQYVEDTCVEYYYDEVAAYYSLFTTVFFLLMAKYVLTYNIGKILKTLLGFVLMMSVKYSTLYSIIYRLRTSSNYSIDTYL